MTYPEPPDYSHGATGSLPSSSLDYQNGDAVDPEHFDAYISTLFTKIKALIDALEAIDSNNDGRVDIAEVADEAADVASTYKGNDIDTDDDGIVDKTDESRALDNSYRTAGSMPHFADSSTGQNNTPSGSVFYNENADEIEINK